MEGTGLAGGAVLVANRIQMVLLGMKNGTFGPYMATSAVLVASAMWWPSRK
jgi:hypothetical protein